MRRGKDWSDKEWKKVDKSINTIRDSNYYKGSKFQEVFDSANKHVIYIDKVTDSARKDGRRTSYHGVTPKEKAKAKKDNSNYADADGIIYLDPKEKFDRMIKSDGTTGTMSPESVLVHEVSHGYDHWKDPAGYKDTLRDFFSQPISQMDSYPNQTEFNSVEEANKYRDSVNESKRVRYSDPKGILSYHDVAPNGLQLAPGKSKSKRYNTFLDGRKRFISENKDVPLFDPQKFIRGEWPKK